MKIALLLLFVCFSLCAQAPQEEKVTVGTVVAYPFPEHPNKELPFFAYAMADVEGNYEDYFNTYKNNTKALEDKHYKRTETISQEKDKTTYQLVFTHWLVGELFRFEEVHTKLPKSQGWMIRKTLAFEGKEEAPIWLVTKKLMKETKSKRVGDDFKHMEMTLSFIDMGENRTRLYSTLSIDSKETKTLEATIRDVKNGVSDVIRLKKEGK